MRTLLTCFTAALLMTACDKSAPETFDIQFQVQFNPTQERLDSRGKPATIPAGNATQTPEFRQLSIHYIELLPDSLTPLGKGLIIYQGAETTKGGANAVDFEQAALVGQNEVFGVTDLSKVPPGTYKYVRASVTYQNFDIVFNIMSAPFFGDVMRQKGTLASFVGFNTYINTVIPKKKELIVRDNKVQGFWVFETAMEGSYTNMNRLYSGQAPVGRTTVVNPFFDSNPIPEGSCIVTGAFLSPLVIQETQTQDRTVTLSFSTKQSFEWQDLNNNQQFDLSGNPNIENEIIVDMGLRGLRATWD